MNNVKLTFDSPWALFLLIPILALILVPWLLIPREKRRGFHKTAPVVLHVLIAVVLVFILAEAGLSGVEIPPDRVAEPEAEEEARETFLIIADSEEAAEIIRPFLPEDIDMELCTPSETPVSLIDLNRYQKIVLLGVSADDLHEQFGSQLALYVEEGGHVLAAGGEHGLSLGNMKGTAYETLLPVSFDYSAEKGDGIALILVIDTSNSMEEPDMWGRSERLSMAKQGTIRCIETLSAQDTVGIISFSAYPILRSSLVPATETQKAVLARIVSSLETNGGTMYGGALQQAERELRASDAQTQHVIFLSDGEPNDGQYIENTIKLMAEEGITISTIAIGTSSPLLSEMASAAGGRYYLVENVDELPDIMLAETETVLADPLRLAETAVIMPGGIPTDLPALHGYVGTTMKENADLMLQTETGDPLLAEWKFGSGSAAAFASDLAGDWTDQWRETNPGRRMLRQIFASGIVPESEEPEKEISVNLSELETRKWTDLLFPFGIVLLILSLADFAIRRLRWKDILMTFGHK
ncbi:MAG: VWA domain-containing protein [Oscillospiraceae bacterium]|nr:VWA domain-containing protein [Oscillospiraceae bacterium]